MNKKLKEKKKKKGSFQETRVNLRIKNRKNSHTLQKLLHYPNRNDVEKTGTEQMDSDVLH